MRTIQEAIAELRTLAVSAAQGHDISADRQRVERELRADHGIAVQGAQAPQPAALAHRGGSRFAGQGADPDWAAQLAAQGPDYGHMSGMAERGMGGRPTLAGAMTKALAESTISAGGVAVPVEVSNEIVALVRNRTSVLLLGPTVVPVAKELDIPSFSSGTLSQFVAENARLPVSEPTFAIMPKLTPYEIGGLTPVSNRLLRDASTTPSLDDALRSDMADSLSARLDLAFLDGTGVGQPLGLRGQPNTTAPMRTLGANGNTPTFDDVKGMVAALRGRNAPFRNPGWIFSPRTLDGIERLKDSTGRYLGDNPNLLTIDPSGNTGKLLGYRFVVTGNVQDSLTVGTSADTSYIVFSSDWQEAWVGENRQLTIDASDVAPYSTDGGATTQSAWQQRQTVFRITAAYDICLRRPEWFCVMGGVRPLVG